MVRTSLVFIGLLLLVSFAYGATTNLGVDVVVVNSQEWTDVYSSILFAELVGAKSFFLTNSLQALELPQHLPRETGAGDPVRVLLLTSRDPVYAHYRTVLSDTGFDVEEMVVSTDMNTFLAEQLEGVTSYVVVNPSFPFDSVSVASYASLTDSYVLFADKTSVSRITPYLSLASSLLFYGSFDRDVKSVLSSYDAQVIDKGDKFLNNLEILNRYLAISPQKQLYATNGEFLREEFFIGEYPVLFIGRDIYPEMIERVFLDNDIRSVVVVGHQLSNPAAQIKKVLRDEHNHSMGVFLEIGTASGAQGNTVRELDYYQLPVIRPLLELQEIRYNAYTKQLEVALENVGDLPLYFRNTITVRAGSEVFALGDNESHFLDSGRVATITYDQEFPSSSLIADLTTAYGPFYLSLENVLVATAVNVLQVSIQDDSNLLLDRVTYDRINSAFKIYVTNLGTERTYAQATLTDVIVDGEEMTLTSGKIAALEPRQSQALIVRAKLSALDIEDNEEVDVRVDYGVRKQALIKSLHAVLVLELESGMIVYVGIAVVAGLVIFFAVLLLRKKEFTCERCNHRVHARKHPGMHHCGGSYRKK
ncbi:MAG: hypothetical protein H6502_01755 [Candidatus Woesearchaeota archaeon]|nr:MAG: hypothetical protein H6502_01755 [Candidatus Woesearchaeota archaeon]